MKSLLSISADAKTTKGESSGILTGILYLAPSTLAGGANVCPFASESCVAACLYAAGRGRFSNVQQARIAKTRAYFANKAEFAAQIESSIAALKRKAESKGMKPAVRLNGTSDINFHKQVNMEKHQDVAFYDYTKNPIKFAEYLAGKLPKNYSLTFSRSESNEPAALEFLRRGGNVAVVFRNELPKTWKGFKVLNGDKSDARFLDRKAAKGKPGFVVGLLAKGKAKQEKGGFVVEA